MTQSLEQVTSIPPADERAQLFSSVLAEVIASQDPMSLGALPDSPDFTVLLDDPKGHVPIQEINPGHIQLEIGSGTLRLYALSREISTATRVIPGPNGRIKPQQVPQPRQFTFRLDNLGAIGPVAEIPHQTRVQ